MTGKEFKEFIRKNIDENDLIDYIDISGYWSEIDINELQISKEEIKGKIHVSIFGG